MNIPETMRAAIVTRYGGPEVIRLETRPVPKVGRDTVLIRTRATTVNSGDARLRAARVPAGFGLIIRLVVGFSGPRQPILGTEAAGEVVAVGPEVTRFAVGDAVLAFVGTAMRCHAEYVAVPQGKAIVQKPDNLSFEEGVGLFFGGTTALHFLRKADVKPGEHVLVIGASGSVGAAMVQLAKHMGANVTAVTSARNVDLVTGLGADTVIDYTTADYLGTDAGYDIIADCVGATSFGACLGMLKPDGRHMAIAGGLKELLNRPKDGKRPVVGMAPERLEDVKHLVDLAKSGEFRAVVDSVFPLAEIGKAHERVDGGHKRGSVVVRVD